jgi:ABC-type transport system involved in multi-copper enzyme maturation permease subunit
MNGVWPIAVYTWREGMRKKTLIGFLILSILVISGAGFMTAFMAETSSEEMRTDVDLKLIKDICVTAVSIFGVLITIFISAAAVPNEVENKVIYTVLSKPVRRYQYLLGKFFGVQFIILINLALMGALFVAVVWLKQPSGERIFPTLLIWSIFLTYLEFLIVSAFTFAVSCTSSSSVLPTIGGLFIYITGHLTEYLKDVYDKGGQTDNFLDNAIKEVALRLYQVLPNLEFYSLRNQILSLPVNDPPRDKEIPILIVYALLYALSGYLMAYWIFRRKEL